MTNTETTKTFQTRLEDLIAECKEQKISFDMIAKEAGISKGAISKYASDKAEIGINNLVKLAKYFNVSADYLIGLTNDKTTDTNLKAVCEYTGLSENAIINLCETKDNPKSKVYAMPVNYLISNLNESILGFICDYYANSVTMFGTDTELFQVIENIRNDKAVFYAQLKEPERNKLKQLNQISTFLKSINETEATRLADYMDEQDENISKLKESIKELEQSNLECADYYIDIARKKLAEDEAQNDMMYISIKEYFDYKDKQGDTDGNNNEA